MFRGDKKKDPKSPCDHINVWLKIFETPNVFLMSTGENTQEVYEIPTGLVFWN